MQYAKRQGAIAGEADIAILLPRGGYGSLILEHKKEGGRHTLTTEQRQYLDFHNDIGNLAISTRGVDAAIAAISAYMSLQKKGPEGP